MLYFKNFNNYDEFKQLFGIVEHGNGNKSRKNKILLGCLKDKEYFRAMARAANSADKYKAHRASKFFALRSMDELKNYAKQALGAASFHIGYNEFHLADWWFYSCKYKLDHQQGICLDGDAKAVRYVNVERDRVFKMKAGKLLTAAMDESPSTRAFPEQLKRWLGEEFSREWQAYATDKLNDLCGYVLHINKDFAKIYNADGDCKGDFGSCMAGEYQHSFYENYVEASAAYLEDADGWVVARCVIYNCVKDEDGNRYRLAERQYSSDGDNVLKQLLVNKLIAGKHIDGYKKVGVDCHANDAFVSNDGEDWSDKDFRIYNAIGNGDTLSYQDSFVYFDKSEGYAYNHYHAGCDDNLDSINDKFFSSDAPWDDYNEEYFREEYAETYISGTSDSYNRYSTNGEHYCFEENFVWSAHYEAYILKDDADWSKNDDDWFFDDEVVRLANGNTARECDCIRWDCEYYLEEESTEVITGYTRSYYGKIVPSYMNVPDDVETVECADVDGDCVLKDAACYSELLGEYFLDPQKLEEAEEAYREEHAAAEAVA